MSPTNKAPVKLWTSEQNRVFLLGSEMRLKCIFGGRPTPQVLWRKIEGPLPTDGRYSTDSEGQEMVIKPVQFSDMGTYECRGSNGKKTIDKCFIQQYISCFIFKIFICFKRTWHGIGFNVSSD